MKKMTIKEVSEMLNVPQGTIRSWTLKPKMGEVYDSSKVNLESLYSGILRYYGSEDFKKKFGFSIEEIEIVKTQKNTKNYIKVDEMKVNDTYILHNYSLETILKLKAVVTIDKKQVYIFEGTKGFKAYSHDELCKENIKMEVVKDELQ